MSKGRYRCIHCGDRFDLSPAEQEDRDEGYCDNEPDTCDDCMYNINHPSHDIMDLHSDAEGNL